MALTAAAALVLTLAGCTAPVPVETPATVETPMVDPSVQSPSPSPTASATQAADEHASPESTPSDGAVSYANCDGAPLPVPAESDEELAAGTVFGLRPFMLRDSGPRAGAQGEVTVDENGDPTSYLVVEGDDIQSVAQRFCLPAIEFDYLNLINAVRRERLGPLYPGDTLNLSPYTITTVGDQDGVVYDNDVSYLAGDAPLPPQR
ncbi:hypothetical protein [Microbacterium marinilacus]|uniref:LysM domain-containing protein n=1 Tax=Microbacterium marinilacus TaxID=415209 RepID=A0ABP7BKE1_9MICO|nr:hypothetical protein [Microbacterium marinilacus]MBY0688432.1 hypothetical protein [Microbacterium marinilacus]